MALPAKRRIDVLGTTMACVDTGAGPVTFLLLHGNPTSSYLWRDVIPELEPLGRCVAPDLVGMGDSAKLPDPGPGSYGFAEHRRYLDGLLDALELTQPLVLVIHDWGSALGFDWARRHPDRVAGIAYMEAIVRPLSWDEWPEAARGIFQGFRSPKGEELILERNLFVEAVLPSAILRTLSDEELAEYRRPFLAPGEDRRPTLTWPRQLPIDGEPADVVADVQAYADWLAGAPVPKLFVDARPGSILTGPARDFCRAWPEQEEVTVAGSHFVQEDSGAAIGRAVAEWATRRVLGG